MRNSKYNDIRGRDGGGEQGVKGKEFQCRVGQAVLVPKSGTPDLGFGWEPTPATTLAAVVPRQASQEVGIGRATWRGTTGDALRI
jgi:hypothetical protein